MLLDEWARRHGVTREAVQELREAFGISTEIAVQSPPLSEAAVQAGIRLEASQAGCRLWRNNVGATYSEDGAFIRYGLCNESKAMNSKVKSSDLVGIRPVLITQEHVGRTIGQFMAREVKRDGWKYTGTKRELAQKTFLELVVSLGGDATFATGKGTI
jgi:hypothetical protein